MSRGWLATVNALVVLAHPRELLKMLLHKMGVLTFHLLAVSAALNKRSGESVTRDGCLAIADALAGEHLVINSLKTAVVVLTSPLLEVSVVPNRKSGENVMMVG